MASIKINGDTSGSITLAAPNSGSDVSLTLPTTALATEAYVNALSTGKILQVVRATDSIARTTTSTTFVDVTGMSVTITPQKSDSAILIIPSFYAQTSWSGADNGAGFIQVTDSSNTAISGIENNGIGVFNITGLNTRYTYTRFTGIAWDSPSTTNAVTYKLRFSAQPNVTISIANAGSTGQMFAIEVAA